LARAGAKRFSPQQSSDAGLVGDDDELKPGPPAVSAPARSGKNFHVFGAVQVFFSASASIAVEKNCSLLRGRIYAGAQHIPSQYAVSDGVGTVRTLPRAFLCCCYPLTDSRSSQLVVVLRPGFQRQHHARPAGHHAVANRKCLICNPPMGVPAE